jgi:hypothetical protein
MENEQDKVPGIPVDAVIAYLNDVYRQLDAISFNIRTNIQNILPKVDSTAEVKDANSSEG